ncbi:predicted protein [Enterococcus faecium 1,231,408]|nr:predicted protein [Enterococcus faecium 1,231,408]
MLFPSAIHLSADLVGIAIPTYPVLSSADPELPHALNRMLAVKIAIVPTIFLNLFFYFLSPISIDTPSIANKESVNIDFFMGFTLNFLGVLFLSWIFLSFLDFFRLIPFDFDFPFYLIR